MLGSGRSYDTGVQEQVPSPLGNPSKLGSPKSTTPPWQFYHFLQLHQLGGSIISPHSTLRLGLEQDTYQNCSFFLPPSRGSLLPLDWKKLSLTWACILPNLLMIEISDCSKLFGILASNNQNLDTDAYKAFETENIFSQATAFGMSSQSVFKPKKLGVDSVFSCLHFCSTNPMLRAVNTEYSHHCSKGRRVEVVGNPRNRKCWITTKELKWKRLIIMSCWGCATTVAIK